MIFALSIGNDLTRIGLADDDGLVETWGLATPDTLTEDEAEAAIYSFFHTIAQRKGTRLDHVPVLEGAIIASVVPTLTDAWTNASQRVCGSRPLIVGPGLKTGIRMNYNDPAEIGADRIANLVGAGLLIDPPFVVVDMGVTTNFSVVDESGAFCGGIIAPGLRLSAQALSQGAAQLAEVDLKVPTTVIGKSTHEALRSGIVLGEVARLDGLLEAIQGELGYEAKVIITGIDASEIALLSSHIEHTEKDLTLKGLVELYRKNRRPSKN